jgi:16S rRNA (guanine527-N7)-methyltransferase
VSDEFHRRLISRADHAHLALKTHEIDQLAEYYRLLARWNRAINLTAVKLTPLNDEGLDRLFIEPLSAAQHVSKDRIEWFDLGSGGGSPAIPMKIVRPSSKLTLIEVRSRKAAFLRAIARELELIDVDVVQDRFENVGRHIKDGVADLVTVRAVRVDAHLLGAAASMCRTRGRLFLFTSEADPPSNDEAHFGYVATLDLVPDGTSRLLVFERRS